MRKPEIHTEGYYHVFNRGVDKRSVFLDESDYRIFYEYMYLFSDANFENSGGDFMRRAIELAGHEVLQMDRMPLVRILSFVLVGNHYHLFLQQLMENGISRFIHKLQKTYSRKFNERITREGGLFEKSYRAVPVLTEGHFLHLFRYQHLNAFDRVFPQWRDGLVADWRRACDVLDSHKWSSHHVYMGRAQSLPIVDERFVAEQFSSVDEYSGYMKEWAGRDALSEDVDKILFV